MRARLIPALGTLLGILFVWAIWNGFARGGQDFRVFQYAGGLALAGRWDALYLEGPDRFLYAPGFAFLISPFAALPATPALAIWLVLTLVAFGSAMRALARRLGGLPVMLAVLFSFRALAIDLRYGQVNLFILSAAVWAFHAWMERVDSREARWNLAFAWFTFAIAAFTKIYPLALFLFPIVGLFRHAETDRRSAVWAFLGATAGAALILVPPAFLSGVYPMWLDALARKGLPTDTHNQSLLATLIRVFGGEPFYALGLGGEAIRFDGVALSIAATRAIWLSFSAVVLGAIVRLGVDRSADAGRRRLVAALALALCFLPAHLIWKSYFVLGIPLLAVLFSEATGDVDFRRRIFVPGLALGIAISFTSGDFVGARNAAWIEAFSPFFWLHLAAIVTGFWRLSCRPSSYSS